MSGCKNLKDSEKHKKMYLSKHMDRDLIAMKANVRMLLKACGREKEYTSIGAFLVPKQQQQK